MVVMRFAPAQQLWVGEDLLESAVVADAEGEDRLNRVAGKMPGYPRREGQNHLAGDLYNTPGGEGSMISFSEGENTMCSYGETHSITLTEVQTISEFYHFLFYSADH